jgi:hypothetical protein
MPKSLSFAKKLIRLENLVYYVTLMKLADERESLRHYQISSSYS